MTLFNQYALYYDLLYQDKDYQVEADYVADLLTRFAPETVRILEFGSGTGRHGYLLAQKGYHLTGLERSQEMLARARENFLPTTLGSFTCFPGDIQHTELDEKFDAVIALFHVISYQTTNEAVLATFQNAARHLEKGGLFLFDVWYTPAVLTQRPAVRVKRMENANTRIVRLAEPLMLHNENVVEVQYTIYLEEKSTGHLTSFRETHPMRHFSLPELNLLAEQTGFVPLHAEEFLTRNVPGEATWGVGNIWSLS